MARALEDIINANTYEDIRVFLRKQDPDEIEQFLRFYGWRHDQDRKVIVEQELARLRAAPKSFADAIEATPKLWGVGINLKKMCQLVGQRIKRRKAL